MKSYIKAIVIFSKNGEKRVVPLRQGVNIITGESKTGKSALVEIIDYCFCSSRCTIPKGKITDFSYLYSLVMCIDNKTYVIARYNPENGGKMYFYRESNEFDSKTLELVDFSEKTALSCKDAQNELECALGLFVTNMENDGAKQKKKASLRNMVSFLFQHQNLIASKFALFYRFSDFYKRKDVIDQFPVFAGIIGQEYYSDLIRLNALKVELKKAEQKQKANVKSAEYVEKTLVPLLKDYYALLDLDFDERTPVQRCIHAAKNLPEFDESQLFQESKIADRYKDLNSELERLRNEERDVLLRINDIKNTKNTGNSYFKVLEELKAQTDAAGISVEEYKCPICGNNCKEIAENDTQIIEATEWLEKELAITERYTSDFSEDIRKLEELHSNIASQIKEVWKQIKTIEKKFIFSKELVSKREKVNYAKAKIDLYVELSDSGVFESVDDDIANFKEQIKQLQTEIERFGVDKKMKEAEVFLSQNMIHISETLDFEDEFKPINLKFALTDGSFNLYQEKSDYERIYLDEMGSGANWVSCHIALFLSFLHYFTSKENSPMPLILFLDQPSQVYFPQGVDNTDSITQTDLIAVNKLYQTIFDEIKAIEKDTGYLPQVIIVDHVDGNSLDCRKEFLKNIRCNWRNGEALI